MVNEGPKEPPALATWAEVDPTRYPFDPIEVPALVRTMVPAPPPVPVWREGWWIGESEAWAWVDAVSMALSDRYGPWAYRWYWGPGEGERLGWVTERIPAPAEAPAFVAGSLLVWRRWLDSLAERFDRLLPLLDPAQAGPGDIVAAWEAAIAHLMRTVVAPVVDDDGWQGWCRLVLRWFLTAADVPAEHAEALVNSAVDKRFDHWVPLTAADIGDIAERLTRDVLSLTGTVVAAPDGNWPDTWPQGWPSWRATNT
ncbi:hypothetical protein CA850_24670 [Micromonospora echinospora]|uniref:Uncharacterized protein n=2 Tax=Micromonospora echinospora TaxID=1877 RepID=A0A1C4YY02_MICEC|nr:hypothetical protein [Micromonospora echinospora]OZV77195.1 hypothetical protein CA850_24670 [Micromonospora echinospora]SCF25578.1 hypothetical protein GA0070618_4530 [Micromonospora echinospora]